MRCVTIAVIVAFVLIAVLMWVVVTAPMVRL